MTSFGPAADFKPAATSSASISTTPDTVSWPWSEQTISSTSSPAARSRSTASITMPAWRSAWRSTARCSGEPSGLVCCVWSGSPSHRIGERRLALAQRFVDEALGHRALARRILFDVQRIERDAAGRERAGAVIDVAVAVRIVRVGRAGRDVVEHDHAAVRCEPLGQRRHGERTARDRALVLQEVGLAGIVVDERAVLQQGQGVALQLVARGMAAGRQGRRYHAGGRWEGGTVRRKPLGASGEIGEMGRSRRIDEVASKAVEDHKDSALHVASERTS